MPLIVPENIYKYLQERSWAAIKLQHNQEIPKPESVQDQAFRLNHIESQKVLQEP